MTRVNDTGLLVKTTLKVPKEDIDAENKRVTDFANLKTGADAANVSTLLAYSKGVMQLSEHSDNFENVSINIPEKYPDEAFKKKMKGRLK